MTSASDTAAMNMPPSSSSKLLQSSIASSTLLQYKNAVKTFETFCSNHNYLGTTPSDLDNYMSIYMESLYDNAIPGGKSKATNALFGYLTCYPQLKGSFPISRKCLKGYQNLAPSHSRPPLTYQIAVAIAATMTRSGFRDYGIAVLLMFHCYLRAQEMCDIQLSDITLKGDIRLGGTANSIISAAVRIGKSKRGKNEFITITDQSIQSLLAIMIKEKSESTSAATGAGHGSYNSASSSSSSGKFFSFSYDSFLRLWHRTLKSLGIDDIGYVPHSLRHGGATHDYLAGIDIEAIQLRGRWKSTEMAKLYIQAGRALLLTVKRAVSSVHKLGEECSIELVNNLLALAQLHLQETVDAVNASAASYSAATATVPKPK